MSDNSQKFGDQEFNTAAAITRSLLGWGLVAGPFYLIVGIAQGLTREGFDFSRHGLSQLMLGDFEWIQTANLILTGVMALAAALGLSRIMSKRTVATLVAVYGFSLIGSGLFPPDPVAGFPPGAEADTGSVSGMLHLAFGGIGFIALAAAAWLSIRWFTDVGGPASLSRVASITIIVGFLAGAALATQPIGVLLLWISVIAGLVWLFVACRRAYQVAPHPDESLDDNH